MVEHSTLQDIKLILLNKSFLQKNTRYKFKILHGPKIKIKLFGEISMKKDLGNFIKKPFFRNTKSRFSFNFNVHIFGQKIKLDKIYKKVSILKKTKFKQYHEKLVGDKKNNFDTEKKHYSSMESHFLTKNNEAMLIEHEKREEIDDLIRKEIIRIIKFKGKDIKNSDGSVKTIKPSSDGKKGKINPELSISNKKQRFT